MSMSSKALIIILVFAMIIITGSSCKGTVDESYLSENTASEPAEFCRIASGKLSKAERLQPQTAEEPERNIEAEYIAKTVWGEALGCSKTEQAAVIWCILNRVDSDNPYFPDDVISVITQPYQFVGYNPSNPVDEELYNLALDVLTRWNTEKENGGDVGRVLPSDYLFFHGDGRHNYFCKSYQSDGAYWSFVCDSPYDN